MFTRRRCSAPVRRPCSRPLLRADVPDHLWQGYDFGPGPKVADRLNQGPFPVEQDQGWRTLATTTPSARPVRNFGLGSAAIPGRRVDLHWPPAPAGRRWRTTSRAWLRFPFVDLLYIRCDWRDVQTKPGKLDLSPVWKLTLDAAKAHGKRVAFRVMLSNTAFQP